MVANPEERRDRQCEGVKRCEGEGTGVPGEKMGGRRLRDNGKAQARISRDAGGLGSCRTSMECFHFLCETWGECRRVGGWHKRCWNDRLNKREGAGKGGDPKACVGMG